MSAALSGSPDEIRRDLIAVSKQRAAHVAGITVRQVDYWDKQGVTHPSVSRRISAARTIKLYDYRQLMSLQVAAELRHHNVTLQQMRRLIGDLREQGFINPLLQVRYAVDEAGHLYFDLTGDDEWEGPQLPGQYLVPRVLDLDVMDARIVASLTRPDHLIGVIESRRGTMGSKPVFAGTRVPVATVRRYLASGRSVSDVLAAFPILSEADVAAAVQA